MSPLAKLAKVIPPPANPDPFEGDSLHSAYGPSLRLPSDYIDFMNLYGPGWFVTRFPLIRILDLTSERDAEIVMGNLEMMRDLYDAFPDECPQVYPATPGVLPWGELEECAFCWLVDGPSDDWNIDVCFDLYFESQPLKMVDFLYKGITREIEHPLFGEKLCGVLPSQSVSQLFYGEVGCN